MTLSVRGTRIEDNDVRAYGSAIFFVGNDHSGTIELRDSVIRHNKRCPASQARRSAAIGPQFWLRRAVRRRTPLQATQLPAIVGR